MASDLEFIANFGSFGTGNQNLNSPQGFAVDNDFLYIADTINHRLLKWKLAGGAYVAQTGSLGSGDDNFNTPIDVCIFKNRLFIADSQNDRIKIYDKNLNFISSFGSTGTGNTKFDTPKSITTDNEFLYISDSVNSRIVRYDRNLNYVSKKGTLGSGNSNLDTPNQIFYDDSEKALYIADSGNLRVVKWRTSNFSFIDKIDQSDSIDGSLLGLVGVGVKDHYVYVSEVNRIQVFDSATLTTRKNAGSAGSGNSNIAGAGYVKFHRNTVIFSDNTNHRINIWYNYKPSRSFATGDSFTIGGKAFKNPFMVIGGKQDGHSITIGGTTTEDKVIGVEEEGLNDNYLGVRET